ncbi:MAG: phosphoribosylformylglycinamidine synthase subunit PurQ [Spirochaetia bacterium]|nr:phosphoribosylformylglycinamidine synthase subunit PurQ [Spirochaetia bacterium]
MSINAIIVTGYGINADAELADAFKMAGAVPRRAHAADLLADPAQLASCSILAFPGGFSFGDHLGSGLVLANLFRSRMAAELKAFVAGGGLVLGICNGFQTLVKAGFLPDLDGYGQPSVALVHNDHGRFVDDWVGVRFEPASRCVWTAGLEPRLLPIRHGEGCFVGDDATLGRLEANGLVALRYDGRNPNGSVHDIAGICDPTGRILGLMPHPEASIHPDTHPARRRPGRQLLGLDLFRAAVRWLEANNPA